MSIWVLLEQVLIIFLNIGVGYGAAKIKLIDQQGSGLLSNLVMTVTLPCTLLASANVDTQPGTVGRMLLGFALLLALYLVCSWICLALAKALHLTPGQKAVFVALAVLPNSAFIGIPLATAILGAGTGAIYSASGILAYNLFFFTYVVHLFDPDSRFSIRSLITPTNVTTVLMAIMLVTGLRLPGSLQSFCSAMGSCTTPLALMIVGVMLAGSDLKVLIRNRFLYGITLLRCVLFPLAFIGVLYLLPVDRTMAMGISILAACPAGSLGAVLARQRNVEPELASQAVAHSTFFILITIPILLSLAGALFLE